jgi:hypothetical protein
MNKKNILIVFMAIFVIQAVWISVKNTQIRNEKLKDPDIFVDPDTGDLWQNEIYTDEEQKAYAENKVYNKVQSWESAHEYCKGLQIDNIDGWELPTIDELKRAYKIGNYFKDDPGKVHWSATTTEDNPNIAYAIFFNGGLLWQTQKSKTAYVRCIKKDREK